MVVHWIEWQILWIICNSSLNHSAENWDSILCKISEEINGRWTDFIPFKPSHMGVLWVVVLGLRHISNSFPALMVVKWLDQLLQHMLRVEWALEDGIWFYILPWFYYHTRVSYYLTVRFYGTWYLVVQRGTVCVGWSSPDMVDQRTIGRTNALLRQYLPKIPPHIPPVTYLRTRSYVLNKPQTQWEGRM